MKQHAGEFGLAAMCRVLRVHRSGYYAWLRSPPASVGDIIWSSSNASDESGQPWLKTMGCPGCPNPCSRCACRPLS